MDEPRSEAGNLSDLNTLWTIVDRAKDPGPQAREAQGLLVQRYEQPIRKYLHALLKDPHLVDEVLQEFWGLLVAGRLARARADRGKFRYYVKTILIRLSLSAMKRRRAAPAPLQHDVADESAEAEVLAATGDLDFVRHWRDELIRQAFEQLRLLYESGGPAHYVVLSAQLELGGGTREELARVLSSRLRRRIDERAARKLLSDARRELSDRLLRIVALTLEGPTPTELEEELIELDLFAHCQGALERRRRAMNV
jgi:RNA polymerase sigma-70 factor (ECF subfamily)